MIACTVAVHNWAEAKKLYLSGVSTGDIRKALSIPKGTIDAKVNREGWLAEKQALQKRAAEVAHAVASQKVIGKAEDYLARVTRQVDLGLSVLESDQPATRKELDDHFEALGKIDKVARPALGLTDNGGRGAKTLINLNLLTNAGNYPQSVEVQATTVESPQVEGCQELSRQPALTE